MGKRKKSSRKPQGPKKQEPLAKVFTCLFCNHEKTVIVKIERKNGVGNLRCKVCGQSFQTSINYLTAPVDVYADWVDACDAVSKSRSYMPTHLQTVPGATDRSAVATRQYADDEDAQGEPA